MHGRRVSGRWRRAVGAKRAGQMLDPAGSLIHGGRYNAPQAFGVLYLCQDEEGCRAELLKQSGGNPALLSDLVVGEVEVDLSKVLDLTDATARERLGVTEAALTDPQDVRLPREIGAAAVRAGFQGIVYPSAAKPGGRNLAVFLGALPPGKVVLKGSRALRFPKGG